MDEENPSRKSGFDRRQWVKLSAVGGLGLSTTRSALSGISSRRTAPDLGPPPDKPFAAAPLNRVRIGFVGVGGQGSNHVKNLLQISGAELRAVCDLDREKVERIQAWTKKAGQPEPKGFWRGEIDFKRMCQQEDSGSGLHGDALEVARAGVPCRNGSRKTRSYRSSCRAHDR